jgi:hypothetical protein
MTDELDLDAIEALANAVPDGILAHPYQNKGGVTFIDLDLSLFAENAKPTILALVAEVRRLRAVVDAVEWVDDDGIPCCPWCGVEQEYINYSEMKIETRDHAPDCPRLAVKRKAETIPTTSVSGTAVEHDDFRRGENMTEVTERGDDGNYYFVTPFTSDLIKGLEVKTVRLTSKAQANIDPDDLPDEAGHA